MFKKKQLTIAVAAAISSLGAGQAYAQDDGSIEEIVVTGIRGSLQQSIDVKRNSHGVVDAISAEDMGAFPDTNLAESLQRITGVSINRVNGEGSEVTVRGFGGNFNLVTLNGRQMPSANVTSITGNPLDQARTGTSRSFDFSNLASEGIRGLQVYKTGRAAVPTGGVGATINVQTIRPLDGSGNQLTFGAKAMDDQSGDDVTGELSGLVNWANADETFGVTLFGSYQDRDSGSRHTSVERYDLVTWGPESLAVLGMQNANITNAPADGTLVAIPSNIGHGVNEDSRERLNGQLTLQFRPSDALTLTLDGTYAENTIESTSLIDGIWFARQFTDVEFDGNPIVATPIRLTENIEGGKDFFFQNLLAATKDELTSVGFNVNWDVSDTLNLRFDVAVSEAESGGDGPFGQNVTRFNVAGATAGWQTADFSQEVPQGSIVIDDILKGNNNGIFDLADVGTQVTRGNASSQESTVDQFRLDGTWDLKDDVVVDFGVGYIATEMEQKRLLTIATLGGWGIDFPGDIPEGLISTRCTGCEFEETDINGVAGADAIAEPAGTTTIPLGSVSFGGNALELLNALAPVYGFTPGDLPPELKDDNTVEEDIVSAYIQASIDGELAGMTTNLVVGVRYEYTDVTSVASQAVPTGITWLSDNDFLLQLGASEAQLSADHSYNNFLPSLDFSLDLTDNLKGRVSFSQTLARPNFSQLFSATAVNVPPRPTLLGGAPSGSVGNAALDPLESNNVDLSLEYYHGDSSMASIGYYRKNVSKFVGTEQVSQPLFGLLDPTSGQPGTLSGDAVEALNSLGVTVTERNFFTMAAILDNPAAFPGGAADFDESQAFADAVFGTFDIIAQPGDPEFRFELTRPINNQSAEIYGFEFGLQHFFGESGFGVIANYTTVEGDIGFDIGSDPTVDQFALEGLSDSANVVLVYEKYGVSARLAYNWRDEFLDEVNRAVSSVRNPLFVDEHEQLDFRVGYDINDNFTVSFEAINLTEEGQRQFGRSVNNPFFVQEIDARYVLGLRYTMN